MEGVKQGLRDKFFAILKAIERVEMWIAKLFLVVMITVVGMQVFCRYILNHPLAWPEELCGFLLIWLTFLVADILLKRKGHVSVEYFFERFPEKVQNIIDFLVNLYVLGFLVFLIISSVSLEAKQIHHLVGASLRIPKAYYTMAVTWSAFSMALTVIVEESVLVGKILSQPRKEQQP